jgi:hypothetical protein
LIELRCALWVSPPSITAFGLPALSFRSVRASLVRPAQVPGRYIASASQVLVSVLVRRLNECPSCYPSSHQASLQILAIL